MQVLITVIPFAGHVGPLRPVAAERIARGHDVRVHTGRRCAGAFEAPADQAYAVAAARIAAGFARHDGPREVADLLERLAEQHGPVVRAGGPLWP